MVAFPPADTLVYPSGGKCDWAYSDPLLSLFDGYSDYSVSGNAFHFTCDTFNCGRYACVTYQLDKTCYDSKGGIVSMVNDRVTRGCVGFDIEEDTGEGGITTP